MAAVTRMMTPKAPDPIPYVYHEYPKWITGADGVRKIVANADEEARETAPPPKPRATLTLPKKDEL